MGIREDYMSMEKAEVGNLQDLLSRIGAGLDEFLKFEHADALAQQNAWKPVLDIALPELGVGIDEVTRELVENIIPFGSPVTKPGFTSFITTGATSAQTRHPPPPVLPRRSAICPPHLILSKNCHSTGSIKKSIGA
jgi:hypothetical protein